MHCEPTQKNSGVLVVAHMRWWAHSCRLGLAHGRGGQALSLRCPPPGLQAGWRHTPAKRAGTSRETVPTYSSPAITRSRNSSLLLVQDSSRQAAISSCCRKTAHHATTGTATRQATHTRWPESSHAPPTALLPVARIVQGWHQAGLVCHTSADGLSRRRLPALCAVLGAACATPAAPSGLLALQLTALPAVRTQLRRGALCALLENGRALARPLHRHTSGHCMSGKICTRLQHGIGQAASKQAATNKPRPFVLGRPGLLA